MEIIDKHIDFIKKKILGESPNSLSKEEIEINQVNIDYFKSKFSQIFKELKFKSQKNSIQELTKDQDFLFSYMQLYKLDNSHQIFNNAMQWFINNIDQSDVFQFVLNQLNKDYQFNSDWTYEAFSKLIDLIYQNYHTKDILDIILYVLKFSDFQLEQILKNITTSLQFSKIQSNLTKIDNMHPIIYLIAQLPNLYDVEIQDAQFVYNQILTAFRHFFRDILRNYAIQQKNSRLGEFVNQFCLQIPQNIDKIYCSTQLITLFINEIANTISYLQYEKKLMSQSKLKLLNLVINIQNNCNLYRINFYFNYYDIKQGDIGTCQLCLYENQQLINFYETEMGNLLLTCCKECFSSAPQISNHYEDQIYLQTIIYGQSVNAKDNWIKVSYQNYLIQQKINQQSKKTQKYLNQSQYNEINQFLNQITEDFKRIQNMHYYLWYYAYMSFIFQQLFQTLSNIELILLAFFEDNSIQVRAKVLQQLTNYCIKIAKLECPNNFKFNIFSNQNIIERIKLRSQDVSKQIRGLVVQSALQIWQNCEINFFELILNRLSDIEYSVRFKTITNCIQHVDLFRNIAANDKIRFFEEVSKRLEDQEEIANSTSQLFLLLLVYDTKLRDQEITDKLLELTLESNNVNLDYERITNLVDKLSDNNKIIDKGQLLKYSLIRLVQIANNFQDKTHDKEEIKKLENVLRLIQILMNTQNEKQQKITIKQIDNIMEITQNFLTIQEENENLYANILNGLFKIIIFCLEEFKPHPTYEKLQFSITQKIQHKFDFLTTFLEKIQFKIHPKTPFMRSMFQLSTLLDLKLNKNYKNIYTKFELIIKLIVLKGREQDSFSFQFALIAFSQIFEYFEYFIQKVCIDIPQFLKENIQILYDNLMEFSMKKDASEEIIYAMSKLWEKIPTLMFNSCEFLKENLKSNTFQEQIIIAIYQIFYKAICDADQQSQQSHLNVNIDKSELQYMIKGIFNVVFKEHILHENKKIRVLVLKLIEIQFDKHLQLALEFGDYLIVSLMNDPEISESIIKKCIQTQQNHMLMQFQKGIKLLIEKYKTLKPYFTNLDQQLKNLNKTDLTCRSEQYDVCTTRLSEYLLYLDDSYFVNKIDVREYFFSTEFILYQIINLQYLSKHEIKIILKSILNRFDDLLLRIENKQQINIEKDFTIVKTILLKLFYAYQIAIKPEYIFNDNIKTLRQVYQSKIIKRKQSIQKKKTKQFKDVQCFEITHKHINKFNQYINSNEMNLNLNIIDVSDNEDNQNNILNKTSSSKINQYNQETELIEKILDCELGHSEQMFKLFDEYGVFDKVEDESSQKIEQIQESILEEVQEEEVSKQSKKKSKRKTKKQTKKRINKSK